MGQSKTHDPALASLDDDVDDLYALFMRKSLLSAILILVTVVPSFAAQKPLQAEQILAAAKAQAAKENKSIFVIFGASWCEDCHRLDAFLAVPEIEAIFNKHFVITRITVAEENGGNPALNNPGGLNLLIKFGGVGAGGAANLPFSAILDVKGKLIANSNLPKGHPANGGIGYPTKPEEIDWFVTMLKKGSPAINAEEQHIIKDALAGAR